MPECMAQQGALPPPLLKAWNRAEKSGLRALQWFALLCAREPKDAKLLDEMRFAIEKVQDAADALSDVCDQLTTWRDEERLTLQRRGVVAQGGCDVAVLQALALQVEQFQHESSTRAHIAHSLTTSLDADACRTCVLAWKLKPFLHGHVMQEAHTAMAVAQAMAARLEMEARYAK